MEHTSDDESTSVFICLHRMTTLFYGAGARVAWLATAVAVGVKTESRLRSVEKRRRSFR
jgi:hypothetical protein